MRPGQRLKNYIIWLIVRAAFWMFARLPYRVADLFLLGLGALAPYVARADARRAREQLMLAFPELSATAVWGIVRAMFRHLGRSMAEMMCARHFVSGPARIVLDEAQARLFAEALAEGRGVIAITGHIGNWELLAQVLCAQGLPVTTIAKPLYDPRLTELITKTRCQNGLEILWRGDPKIMERMYERLASGRVLAFLIDQHTKVPGVSVPFFHAPAHTATAPALLALKTGAPIIVGFSHRVHGAHRMCFERYRVSPGSDPARITADITKLIEGAIRQHPEQWVWFHRRWRGSRCVD